LSDPRLWAAFVLNGDGMQPVPRFIPWQALLVPLLVMGAAALVLLQLRKWRKSKRLETQVNVVTGQT
jgi:hypothetical protein